MHNISTEDVYGRGGSTRSKKNFVDIYKLAFYTAFSGLPRRFKRTSGL